MNCFCKLKYKKVLIFQKIFSKFANVKKSLNPK